MTRSFRHMLWAWLIFWLIFGTVLMAAAICHSQPLDTGGWRASSDEVKLHQFGPSFSCPTGGCPTTRSGSIWLGAGINQYREPGFAGRQAQQPRAFVCQMIRGGFAGSGVYVGKVAGVHAVLTAKHVGAVSSVRFGNGSTAQVTAAFSDHYDYDLVALIVTGGPPSLAALGKVPQPGEVVTVAGYPNGRYGERSGPVTGFLSPQADQPWGDMLMGFSCGGPGDSGGPVLDRAGHLIGIHYGRFPDKSLAVSVPAIKDFLARIEMKIRGAQTEPPPVLPGPGPDPDPSPVEPPLVPIEPEGPPTPHPDLTAISERLDALAAQIAAIPAGRTGDTGQQGERGLQGKKGERGEPGVYDPATMTDAQVAALVERLPPLPVRQIKMQRKDGKWVAGEEKVDQVYFGKGEGLTIRLFPPSPDE